MNSSGIVLYLKLIAQVGFPVVGALAAGYFVFLTVKFILDGVTSSINNISTTILSLDDRVHNMNNDLIKIDVLLSYVLGVKPNVDRISANEGKDDARKD